MTEVALGLSMAFFTLLIVALLSISLPKDSAFNESKHTPSGVELKNSEANKKSSETQFAFYFHNQLYDQALSLRTIDSFPDHINLVIAVEPQLAFAEVFALRQKLNHPKLSMTTLNDAWQSRLEQLITSE